MGKISVEVPLCSVKQNDAEQRLFQEKLYICAGFQQEAKLAHNGEDVLFVPKNAPTDWPEISGLTPKLIYVWMKYMSNTY